MSRGKLAIRSAAIGRCSRRGVLVAVQVRLDFSTRLPLGRADLTEKHGLLVADRSFHRHHAEAFRVLVEVRGGNEKYERRNSGR